MASTLDNSTDRPREGDDADQERWEQSFRDGRPQLPDEAMARIETSIHKEMDCAVPGKGRSRLPLRLMFLIAVIIVATFIAIRLPGWIRQRTRAAAPQNAVQYQVEDRYPVSVVIGPEFVAPDRPVLPLEEYPDLLGLGPAPTTQPATQPAISAPDQQLLAFTAQLPHAKDLHGMLGQWDLRRVLEHRGPGDVDAAALPKALDVQSAWNLLPLQDSSLAIFQKKEAEMRPTPFFWGAVYTLCLAHRENDESLAKLANFGADPKQFPSKDCDWARLDILNETGMLNAEAGLAVLTTRSYEPLRALAALDAWSGAESSRKKLHGGYLRASQDLIETIFSLRLAGREADADDLRAKARKLTYLIDPRDMAFLLARLGPDDAWDKLVRPLMSNEVMFIQNPPNFAAIGPRRQPELVVSALTKSVQEGVTVYAGQVLIKVGARRIKSDKLKVFRNADRGTLLTGTENVQILGVLGYLSITADEFTFNTETGDLKLSGSVQLQAVPNVITARSARITRTGELVDVEH